ncbi:hypothetical protein CIPAW_12G039200 [Carya illinoinensis]|uniref:Uncharacterized protein n=1 Tax=Carya illinoinensis TaxID=32201 RepID=A0A8T1NVB3_CARIL|nr:hypothetical protein CIPAW_12G039200 [Carya illinoinensis]
MCAVGRLSSSVLFKGKTFCGVISATFHGDLSVLFTLGLLSNERNDAHLIMHISWNSITTADKLEVEEF